MALTTNFADSDTTATVHARHHNDMATLLNASLLAPKVTGLWYDQRIMTASSTALTLVSNRCYFVPVFIRWATTIDRIAVVATGAGAAGSTLRLGYYPMNLATGLPTGAPTDYGTVDNTVTGDKAIAISQALPAGWSYLAVTTPSVGPGTISGTALGVPIAVGWDTVNGSVSNGGIGALYVSTSGGALPTASTLRADYATLGNGTPCPLIFYRTA